MTADEFDKEMSDAAEWFNGETKKLAAEWESKITYLCERGEAAGISKHLLAASAQKAINLIEGCSSEIRKSSA